VLVYPDPVSWSWRDRPPARRPREAVRSLFDRLADFDPVQDGAAPADEAIKLPWFHFDEAAQQAFIAWSSELHMQRIETERSPLMRQHLAKYEKLYCSLALILHLAEGRIGPVQADTAQRAAVWCEYLESHARRIYGLTEVTKVNAALTLANRLLEHKLSADGFTARDVVRKGWGGLLNTAQAESALAVLEEHGWVVGLETPAESPGRPTTRYVINPRIHHGAPHS
jgi:hypothetical protein